MHAFPRKTSCFLRGAGSSRKTKTRPLCAGRRPAWWGAALGAARSRLEGTGSARGRNPWNQGKTILPADAQNPDKQGPPGASQAPVFPQKPGQPVAFGRWLVSPQALPRPHLLSPQPQQQQRSAAGTCSSTGCDRSRGQQSLRGGLAAGASKLPAPKAAPRLLEMCLWWVKPRASRPRPLRLPPENPLCRGPESSGLSSQGSCL